MYLKLKTGRIYLRPLKKSDAKLLFEAIELSRPELDRFMIWSPQTTKVKHSAEFIQRTVSWRRRGNAYAFGIFEAGSDQYLGNTGLHNIRKHNNSAEIGYWVRSDWSGKGIATESSVLILKFAFELLRVHRVTLRAADDNLGSIRVAEKLGFLLDGVERDEMHLSRGWLTLKCYSMLAQEYQDLKGKLDSFMTK